MPGMSTLSERVARMLALFVALGVVGVTVRYNSFIPWGTDSGAYLGTAYGLAGGDLYRPQTFVFRFPWASDTYVESPLGHRGGETRGTYTSFVPLGYPTLLAAAVHIGGELAPHVVAPLCAGLLAWCAFLLGRALSTGWAGVIAALLIASTPVTLVHSVMAMSDVPSTAFWALAWVMSLRPGLGAAAAAGAATAMAVMIRPNLAPLVLVIAGCIAAAFQAPRRQVMARLLSYGAIAAIGPAIVMWSQVVRFGAPLNSGYPASLDFLFNVNRIPQNAQGYPARFVRLHSWLPLTGLLMVPIVFARRASTISRTPLVVALGAVGMIGVNYALYLAYLTFEDWQSLRFMLPAILAVFVLFAGLLDAGARLVLRNRSWLVALASLAVAWVVSTPREEIRSTIVEAGWHRRLQVMGGYLREALPRNAVILTFVHGGALALYTGRPIIRLDVIGADGLDRIVGDLQRSGHEPVFVLDLSNEFAFLADKFKASRLLNLNWHPRAEFTSAFSVYYFAVADRERFFSGDDLSVDVLRVTADVPHQLRWMAITPPDERVKWPLPEETTAFRTVLERTYRVDLRRPLADRRVDAGTALVWTRRYLRYRIHGCDHAVALAKVFDHIHGRGPASLCAGSAEPAFPPRDETVQFRRTLEETFPARDGPGTASSVDIEGETVWLQEYLQRRVAGCSHADATVAVTQEIVAGRRAPECRP
jgi:hypothetical protein